MKLKIVHDEHGFDFWEHVEDITFISNHRHYSSENLLNKDDECNQETIDRLKSEDYTIVPVYAYIHGGIALSVNNFNDKWDSGMFGLLVFKPEVIGDTEQGVKSFVNEWSQCLNGEIYGYTITDDDKEVIDSCWGMIGHDTAESEGKAMMTYLECKAAKKRLEKLKSMVKNKVPLQYRNKLLSA